MSFTSTHTGSFFEAGYFLQDDEHCVRLTKEIPKTMATADANGKYIVKAGTPFPANGSTAVGILYEDVDVTSGNMPGSVVVAGRVVEDKLPVTLETAAKTALAAAGIVLI